MVAHLEKNGSVKQIPEVGVKRYLFTDNFYTRHYLARKIFTTTDSTIYTTGTVRFNYIDEHNKANVAIELTALSDKKRGSWVLVPAYDPPYKKKW